MRLVNDKEERREPIEVDLFAVLSQGFLCSLGMATFFLSPLPVIHSHLKLVNPWAKVSTLIGAILAIVVLELPALAVVISFVIGIYIADNYVNEVPFWKNFSMTVLLAALIGGGALFLNASLDRLTVVEYWSGVVDSFIKVAQESVKLTDNSFQWSDLRSILIYQGPYFFLSSSVLLFWFSVGFAAHLGWVKDAHPYSSQSLRKLHLPSALSILFIVLFTLNSVVTGPVHHLVSGMFRLLGTLMFIQGMITLSTALAIKQARKGTRAVVYVFSCVVAFYAVIGLGVLSPWFFRKNSERLSQMTTAKLEEVKI